MVEAQVDAVFVGGVTIALYLDAAGAGTGWVTQRAADLAPRGDAPAVACESSQQVPLALDVPSVAVSA